MKAPPPVTPTLPKIRPNVVVRPAVGRKSQGKPADLTTTLVTGAVSVVVLILAIAFIYLATARADRDVERAYQESVRNAAEAQADLAKFEELLERTAEAKARVDADR